MKGLKNLKLEPRYFVDGVEVGAEFPKSGKVIVCVLDCAYVDSLGRRVIDGSTENQFEAFPGIVSYKKRFRSVGKAVLNENDSFCYSTGRRIAMNRAKSQLLKKIMEYEADVVMGAVAERIQKICIIDAKIAADMEAIYDEKENGQK